eukprot:GEMP01074647.1.p1 GENE.GEMP01074647.1~~GEMP01074647.1.p1  ORF type:complete len:239 (+),score=49.14 GEMP01074647.1:303-1019(+)
MASKASVTSQRRGSHVSSNGRPTALQRAQNSVLSPCASTIRNSIASTNDSSPRRTTISGRSPTDARAPRLPSEILSNIDHQAVKKDQSPKRSSRIEPTSPERARSGGAAVDAVGNGAHRGSSGRMSQPLLRDVSDGMLTEVAQMRHQLGKFRRQSAKSRSEKRMLISYVVDESIHPKVECHVALHSLSQVKVRIKERLVVILGPRHQQIDVFMEYFDEQLRRFKAICGSDYKAEPQNA